ncbi:MAG: 16S rRNA (uracil(1498)-N(3))-methyltransferase [Piscirickettsiaceae bacterium]|nr:16S rRNA (uracil(1498)-N(3))-methyltransferase [Piscirickettsiaceae bacterium]
MRIPRFYCPELGLDDDVITLPAQVHRHAVQVLRLKPGAEIKVFDGKGLEYNAVLQTATKRDSTAKLEKQTRVQNESPLSITLIQGISRGDRMDYTLQKAVELGVNRIVPVVTARCNVQLSGARADKKREHWLGVMISACEQSGRSMMPELAEIGHYETMLASYNQGTRLILEPTGEHGLNALTKQTEVILLIGSEGGFSETELQQATSSGFQSIQFGPRILRTETAAVSAIAVLQTLWGDLG